MKRLTILLTATLMTSPSVHSQDSVFIKNHSGRYRLDLPAELKTPKLMRAITDILPKTMLELKDHDLCSSCKAEYIVKFIIDSMSTDASTIPASYRFKATLRVFDSSGSPVSQLLIISPQETFETSSTPPLKNKSQKEYTIETMNMYDESGTILVGSIPVTMATPAFDNFDFIQNSNRYPLISRTDLVNICKKKILEIKRMLEKLSESGQL